MRPHLPLHRLLASALLPLCLLGSGCGPQYPANIIPPELAGLPIPGLGPVLVIAPADVPRAWTGEQTFKRLSLLNQALSEQGWIVFAPWEYRMHRRAFGAELVTASNLNKVLESWAISPQRVWIVQLELSEALSSQSTDFDTGRGVKTARQHERELEARLLVIDPRLDKVLAGVFVRLQQDPFASSADEIDHLPALSVAIAELAQALTVELVERGAQLPAQQGDAPLLQTNPKRVASYAQHLQSSLDAEFGGYAEFERIARLLRHYQFFDPRISIEEVKLFEDLPIGLRVLEPGLLAEAAFQTGDFLTHVDGLALDGVQAFERLMRLPKAVRRLSGVRDGQPFERDVELGVAP